MGVEGSFIEYKRENKVVLDAMLFFRSIAWNFAPFDDCSFDLSMIIMSGTSYSMMNFRSASWQSAFLLMGYASANICLVPKTWQYCKLLVPSVLGSIVSVATVHRSRNGSYILSVLYRLNRGMIADRTWCWVVASNVNFACCTDIPHISLKSSSVVFECRCEELKVLVGRILSSLIGPSPMIMPLQTWHGWSRHFCSFCAVRDLRH